MTAGLRFKSAPTPMSPSPSSINVAKWSLWMDCDSSIFDWLQPSFLCTFRQHGLTAGLHSADFVCLAVFTYRSASSGIVTVTIVSPLRPTSQLIVLTAHRLTLLTQVCLCFGFHLNYITRMRLRALFSFFLPFDLKTVHISDIRLILQL